MWLFTRYGFYSISRQGRNVAVRARLQHHLVALLRRFPHLSAEARKLAHSDEPIIETPQADYRWRVMVPQRAWAVTAEELAAEQTWGNFKAEAERFNGRCAYTEALHAIWDVMYGVQCADAIWDSEQKTRAEQDVLDDLYEKHQRGENR